MRPNAAGAWSRTRSHHGVLLSIATAGDGALRLVGTPVHLTADTCTQGLGAALEGCSGTPADGAALQHCTGHGAYPLMRPQIDRCCDQQAQTMANSVELMKNASAALWDT